MAASPTITLDGCTIVGKTQPASFKRPRPVDVFYGIPYASAARFGAPILLETGKAPLVGRVDASRPGPVCPTAMAQGEASESPLRLNIFKPAAAAAAATAGSDNLQKLPVAIYFHGGAFNFGNALEGAAMDSFVSHLDPQGKNKGKGVLVVTVAYRLGVLGFLHDGNDAGNLGLRDQRVGVEWVVKWASAFGGDGEDVTLMGVSAGAHSVSLTSRQHQERRGKTR
jgi:para-nitrobenzyl esterase